MLVKRHTRYYDQMETWQRKTGDHKVGEDSQTQVKHKKRQVVTQVMKRTGRVNKLVQR